MKVQAQPSCEAIDVTIDDDGNVTLEQANNTCDHPDMILIADEFRIKVAMAILDGEGIRLARATERGWVWVDETPEPFPDNVSDGAGGGDRTAAERQRRYRARKRKGVTEDDRNGGVTPVTPRNAEDNDQPPRREAAE